MDTNENDQLRTENTRLKIENNQLLSEIRQSFNESKDEVDLEEQNLDNLEFFRSSMQSFTCSTRSHSPRAKRRKYDNSLLTIYSDTLKDAIKLHSSIGRLRSNALPINNFIRFERIKTIDVKEILSNWLSICFSVNGLPTLDSSEFLVSNYVFVILSCILNDFNIKQKKNLYLYSQKEIVQENKIFGGLFDYAIVNNHYEYKVEDTILFIECKLKSVDEGINQCLGYLRIHNESTNGKACYAISLTGDNWMLIKYQENKYTFYEMQAFLVPHLLIDKKLFLEKPNFLDVIYQILLDYFNINLD